MAVIIAIPIMVILMMIQSGVLAAMPLLQGSPDLILLAVCGWAIQKRVETAWHWAFIGGMIYELVSGLPTGVALGSVLATTGLALYLRKYVWQIPVLAMLLTVFSGTVIFHIASLVTLSVAGNPIPFMEALEYATLPTILLNLLLSIPAYAFLADLARWFYPEELEV